MEVPAKEGSEGGLLTQPSPERGAVVEGDSDSDSGSGSDHGGGSALDATGHPAGGAIAGRGCDSGALLTQAPDPDEGAAGSDEGAATCASGDGGSGYSSSVPSSSSSEEEDEEDEEGAALEKDLRAMTSSASGNGTPSIIRRRRRAIQRNQERMQVLFPRLERPGASGDARKRKRRRAPGGGGARLRGGRPAQEGDAVRDELQWDGARGRRCGPRVPVPFRVRVRPSVRNRRDLRSVPAPARADPPPLRHIRGDAATGGGDGGQGARP